MRPASHAAPVAVAAAVLVTAVVAGVAVESQSRTAEGTPATVPDETLEATGYGLVDEGVFELVEGVETADGRSLTLRAQSPAVEYRRTVDLGILGGFQAGAFATVAIPAFEENGTALNPIGELDNREVAALVAERFPALRVGPAVENSTVAVLGNETLVTTFEGVAEVDGLDVEVFVHVTAVRDGADFVVAVGVHPRIFPDERERIFELLAAVEH